MKSTAPILGVALLALALAVAPDSASACSCAPPPPVAEAVEQADAVFVGEVVTVEVVEKLPHANRLRATLRVEAAVKGDLGDEMAMTFEDGCCYCEFQFEKGKRYLVYADRNEDGELRTSICHRSGQLRHVSADLEALGLQNESDREPSGEAPHQE